MSASAVDKVLLTGLKKKLEAQQQALQALRGTIVQHSHIVMTGSRIALSFKVEGGQVSNPEIAGGAHLATRFEKADAERVAQSLTDGNGEVGRAVPVAEALRTSIEYLAALIEELESAK